MWDAVVLGLGGVGSFALRALARRGVRVLGLEQFAVGHDRGSSHGGTRVFRHAYFEHADYVPLLIESSQDFRALGKAVERPLLESCGTLLIGERGCEVLSASLRSANAHGIPVHELDADALRARYPLFRVPDSHAGLLEPSGGFVRPEASIHAAIFDAREHGAEVREEVRVRHLAEVEDHVVLSAADGEIRARRLIVTTGAWTARLVPELERHLRVTLQVQAWIAARDPASIRSDRMPAWLIARGSEPPLYGLPADPQVAGTPLTKIAIHGRDESTDADVSRRELTSADHEELMALVRDWLPRLGGNLVSAKSCLYTVSPDDHFIVDRAPHSDRTWIVAGLSGHGFKLTPALGRAVADLALDGSTSRPIEFLNLARLSG